MWNIAILPILPDRKFAMLKIQEPNLVKYIRSIERTNPLKPRFAYTFETSSLTSPPSNAPKKNISYSAFISSFFSIVWALAAQRSTRADGRFSPLLYNRNSASIVPYDCGLFPEMLSLGRTLKLFLDPWVRLQ